MSGEEYDEDEFEEVGSEAVEEEEEEEEEEEGGGGGDGSEKEEGGGESQGEGGDEEGKDGESDAASKGNGDDDDPAKKRAGSPGDDGEQVEEPGHASQGLPPSQSQPTARPGGEVRKTVGGMGATWLAQTEKNDAISGERKKWEKVLEASEAAGKAAEKQVQELTKQVAELRERAAAAEELANNYSGVAVKQEQDLRTRVEVANKRAADAEEKCATKDAEITKMRLECLGREKAAARRAREESELALLAERRASEEAIQRLGAEEEERVRKRVAAAKREWEKKMSEVEAELQKANEVNAVEDKTAVVKRERARARRLEKQVEQLNLEIDKLKGQLLEKGQQQFHGSIQNLAAEPPEVSKLHKQVEFYKSEARMLRSQLDAQRPEKVLALQGSIKQQSEEADKLRDEIKTLKNMMGRQERAINQSKDLDNDYAAKLQSIIGDLTVAKDENRRLRERLEASEKTAKSRSAIEEGMRRKVEGLEKKLKAQKELLREKVAEQVSGNGAGGGGGAQGAGGAGGGADGDVELAKAREEIEAVNKRLLVSESEGKKLKAKLKEKSESVKTLSDLAEKRHDELQAKIREVRSLAVEVSDLKRRLSERAGGERERERERSQKMQAEGEELRDVKTLLAAREAALAEALRRAERVPSLEKELNAARAKIVPTSLADMADMTPRAPLCAAPRPTSQHSRMGSAPGSARRLRPRSKAGESRVNDGFQVLSSANKTDSHRNDSLISDQVNLSGSMEMDGSIIDDSMVCQDYGNDSFENAEV